MRELCQRIGILGIGVETAGGVNLVEVRDNQIVESIITLILSVDTLIVAGIDVTLVANHVVVDTKRIATDPTKNAGGRVLVLGVWRRRQQQSW